MIRLTMKEVRTLVENPEGPCVSIFMPTHRAGDQIRQDPIRLKNLIREAQVKLDGMGLSSRTTKELLAPIDKLLKDSFFWRHQGDGLAIFSSVDLFHCYRLPVPFDELVVATHNFHIKPLLALLASDGRFYVLALSQNNVRLLACTRYSATEIPVEDMPKSLADTLRHDAQRNIQLHTATSTGSGGQSAIFHGHGSGMEDAKTNILKYFRQIDAGLSELLTGEQIPLILAGVDYLHPIYAKANTYKYLIEDSIKGNPEDLSNDELRDRAWAIAESYFSKTRMEAASNYREFAGTQRASSQLTEVLPASYHGRVESLLVAVGVQLWGTFDAETNNIELHQEIQPGDEDLLDFAAIFTLMNGGAVFAVVPDQMPDKEKLAAVFRY